MKAKNGERAIALQDMAEHLRAHEHGFSRVRGIGKTWLIYFGARAEEIAVEGFQRGLPLQDVTGVSFPSSSEMPGWNFAFDAADEYSLRTLVEYDRFGDGFERAVLFRAPGVACFYDRDGFGQVVFRGIDVDAPFLTLHRDGVAGGEYSEPQDAPWSFADETHDDLFAAIDAAIASIEPPL